MDVSGVHSRLERKSHLIRRPNTLYHKGKRKFCGRCPTPSRAIVSLGMSSSQGGIVIMANPSVSLIAEGGRGYQ